VVVHKEKRQFTNHYESEFRNRVESYRSSYPEKTDYEIELLAKDEFIKRIDKEYPIASRNTVIRIIYIIIIALFWPIASFIIIRGKGDRIYKNLFVFYQWVLYYAIVLIVLTTIFDISDVKSSI